MEKTWLIIGSSDSYFRRACKGEDYYFLSPKKGRHHVRIPPKIWKQIRPVELKF